jgi:hypothetical protein
MTMRRIINVLGAVVLVLLLVLRRGFHAAIDEPHGDHAGLRRLLGPATVVLATFLALGVWALVEAGYWGAALVLVAHVALLLDLAWRSSPPL